MTNDLAVVIATLSIYLVVAISPGPNFALISRLAVSGSRSAALAASLGLGIAATSYALLTMTGLAVLLDQVGWLARAIQIAGGAYLIYLGVSAWLSSSEEAQPCEAAAPKSAWYGLRAGLIVAFANPKSIAFFVGLYAAAVPADTALWAKGAIIGGGFMIELLWYGLVTMLLSTSGARAAYRRFGKWIERAIGTMLAGFGLRMILSRP